MRPVARLTIHGFAATAAGVSFLVQPLPGSDQLFTIPTKYLLAASLEKERGVHLSKDAWSQVHTLIWGGSAVRLMLGLTIGLIPIAGAFANAFSAFAESEYVGYYVEKALDTPDKPPPILSVQGVLDAIRDLFLGQNR